MILENQAGAQAISSQLDARNGGEKSESAIDKEWEKVSEREGEWVRDREWEKERKIVRGREREIEKSSEREVVGRVQM